MKNIYKQNKSPDEIKYCAQCDCPVTANYRELTDHSRFEVDKTIIVCKRCTENLDHLF